MPTPHLSPRGPRLSLGIVLRNLRDLAIYVGVYLLFQTFAFAAYHIPSESMRPTLEVGDRLMVSKYAYGYSGQSLPFGFDIAGGRLLESLPERGDVVVFKALSRTLGETVFIKRAIGLPGDRIQMRQGRLYINGEPVARHLLQENTITNSWGQQINVVDYEETLPGGATHIIREFSDNHPLDNTGIYIVPEGHVFMMGDNRDNSSDSRPATGFGMIPVADLIGRAEIITFSLADCATLTEDRCPLNVAVDRFVSVIQ